MPLKVLIIGAGICGPAMATLLRRSDLENSVTVVERSPEIRRDGLQIDLRAWGVPIMQRLGLLETVREKCVHEDGTGFVDSKGKMRALFGVVESGSGNQSFTSEFEIMRGDLVQLLYDASLKDPKTEVIEKGQVRGDGLKDEDGPGVRYKFGTWVTAFAQDEKGVDVTFSNGTTKRYDLVLGADGQWSRTRRMMFGEETGLDMFKRLGLYMGYFTVPKVPEDDDCARFFFPGGGRNLLSRGAGVPGRTQVYLMARTPSEEVRREIERQPVEQQKAVFERLFRGAGWQAERFLDGMRESTDFYADSLGQVKAPSVVKGRIALLGDAAACASPVTGMGTTVSLLGAWVLAGELARHKGDVRTALEAYNANMQSYVDELQHLPPGVPWIMTLHSRWAVTLFYMILTFVSWINIDKLLIKFLPEDKGGLALPEYPELNLTPVSKKKGNVEK